MSVDYEFYLDGVKAVMEHMAEVYRGDAQEEDQDYSYQVLSLIPVLLKSKISNEMRSTLMGEYADIQGHIRDMALALMPREAFYKFAAEMADNEVKYLDVLKAESAKNFQVLTESSGDIAAEILEKLSDEHLLFKSQLANVVKSKLNIPEHIQVGPLEVQQYLKKQKTA